MEAHDVIVLGAGGAGLLCAAVAGRRDRDVLVLEANERIGKKILVSGGGRCNFTNRRVDAGNYVSANPHFARSALARFTPEDFLALVERHGIPFHERKWGQLFCDDSARRISEMLAAECADAGVAIRVNARVRDVLRAEPQDASDAPRFLVRVGDESIACRSCVVATGGLSWPRLGSNDVGYRIARSFGLEIVPPRPGLVPLLFSRPDRERFAELAGIAVFSRVTCAGVAFEENILFTHGGLSGPAILQASNYWRPGTALTIDLAPSVDLAAELLARKAAGARELLRNAFAERLPKRLVERLLEASVGEAVAGKPLAQCAERDLAAAAAAVHAWRVLPAADAGWDKAEVTLGGVATGALSSRTLEARAVPGLHFIGEVVDVTGWLGGFNFQWAWASGAAAGEAV
jgi:predicted Rossmann fold flavoprotein